jgi:hypothetical protein
VGKEALVARCPIGVLHYHRKENISLKRRGVEGYRSLLGNFLILAIEASQLVSTIEACLIANNTEEITVDEMVGAYL